MLIPFDELFKKHAVQADGVLHLGANTGQEAEAYHKHGIPRAVWVEALSELIPQLTKWVSRYPNSTVLNACVSDTDLNEVFFNVANNGAQSSSFLQFGTHTKAHPSVHYVRRVRMLTTRVDTLLKLHGITVGPNWFLNVDLQGAELLALKGMGDLLHRFRYAYIEVNTRELYVGCPFMNEVDDYLALYGFEPKETKMTNWGWGDRFYERTMTTERTAC